MLDHYISNQVAFWLIASVVIASAAVVDAGLRRVFGGYLGLPRSTCTVAIVAWNVLPWFILSSASYDVWGIQVPGYWMGALALALVWPHWVFGHDYAKVRQDQSGTVATPWKLVKRYSVAPVILASVTQFWPALLVGPLCGLSYKAAQLWGKAIDTPLDTEIQRPIDGWAAWGEFGLGFFTAAAWWGAATVGSSLVQSWGFRPFTG